MATAEEIAAAAASNAAAGISSQATDGVQTTAIDPMKQLDVADRIAQRSAVSANTRRGLVFTKLQPPGAS